jgi:hypothetical protein
VRRQISCPTCGLELVQTPDLFGAPRLRHPDTECIPIAKLEKSKNMFTSARCTMCRGLFAQPVKGYRRITCGERCINDLRRHMAKHRVRPNWKPKRETRRERLSRLHWQEKAEVLDKRWEGTAVERNGTVEAPKGLEAIAGQAA